MTISSVLKLPQIAWPSPLKVAHNSFLVLSKTMILMVPYYQSLSLDATIMVSKNCPVIGEHVGIIFVTQ